MWEEGLMKDEEPRLHEESYRGAELMQAIGEARLAICGAGAVGSNLAESLARQGFRKLRVIDHDRVDVRNLSTQVFSRADVGAQKVAALRNSIFRATGVEIDARAEEMTQLNMRNLLKDMDIIVDGFDNSVSRQLLFDHALATKAPCLHVGLSGDYAEVIWNPEYRVPGSAGEDRCDYPLARNLILLATSVAAEVLVDYLAGGSPASYTITLRDLTILSI
jgi:molybdopterin/thiamine biosynthesis adenylyltransferase